MTNIWYTGFDGDQWSSVQQTPEVISLSTPAIAAPNADDLYFAYRSADP
ncbi:hypothetical protein [Streptomyces subrutilus]|nr:hypothetical protein [Streptomyces subrutilus]